MMSEDCLLFGVYFIDVNYGVVVGFWLFIFVIDDGGKIWIKREVIFLNGKKLDLNLFGFFLNGNGEIFVMVEKG